VLQIVEERPLVAEEQASMEGTRFMQCRFPVAHYEWLRYRAFVERTSMNSIVLEAIAALRSMSPDVATGLSLKVISGKLGSVKFNVHLTDELYEWLRTKAFNSRGSINQLLIRALSEVRDREAEAAEHVLVGAGAPAR